MRRFNGSSDFAKFSVGTPSAGASNAYGTMMAIGQFTGGSKDAILIGHQSATNPNTIAFWVTASNNLMASWGSDVTGPTSAGTIPTGSLCFVAVSKATGSATPRFHVYNYSNNSWSHSDGDSAIADNANDLVEWVHGRYEAGAATLLFDDFTGTNSDPPNSTRWPTLTSGGGAIAPNIQSNTLQLKGPASAADSWSAALSNAASADFDVTFDVTLTSDPAQFYYHQTTFRGSGTFETNQPWQTTGYMLEIGVGEGYLAVYSIPTFANVGSGASDTFTTGDVVHLRIKCNGTAIQVKYWLNAASEPGSWNVCDVTGQTTYQTDTGFAIGQFFNANGTGNKEVRVDNVNMVSLGAVQSNYLDAHLHAVGYHANTTYSDAEIEGAGFHLTALPWYRLSHAWFYNQASTAQNVIDLTNGNAHQSALTGTSISTVNLGTFSYGSTGISQAGLDVPTVEVTPSTFDIVTTLPVPAVSTSDGDVVVVNFAPFDIATLLTPAGVQTLADPGVVVIAINLAPFNIVTELGGAAPLAQGTTTAVEHRVLPPEVVYANPIPPEIIQDSTIAARTAIESRLEVLNSDGTLFMSDFDLMGGTVTVSLGRAERRTVELDIFDPDGTIDHHPGGLWYDKIIVPYRSVRFENHYWEAPLGRFYVDRISKPDFPAVVSIHGRDGTKGLLNDKLSNATMFLATEAPEDVIRAVATNGGVTRFNLTTTGKTLGRNMTFEANTTRWNVISSIAEAFSLEVYFDTNGYLVLRPFRDPTTSAAIWSFGTGASGNLAKFTKTADDSRLFNDVVVTGESTAQIPVTGRATNNLVNSPTNVDLIGRRTYPYESKLVTTVAQAEELAYTLLQVLALESYEVAFESLVASWLEVGEVVNVDDPEPWTGQPSRFLLTDLTIPIGLGTMTGTAKRVQLINNVAVPAAPSEPPATPGVTPPTASFTQVPSSPFVNEQIGFADTSTNTPTSWSWNFGDGTTSTQRNPTKSYPTPGTYVVSLTATNAGGSSTAQATITVIAQPSGGGGGGGGSLLTFTEYKDSILGEMLGFGDYGVVTGGYAAASVTVVTNTNDSGTGSLRAAMTGGSNRWIIFDPIVFPRNVEKTITLTTGPINMRSVNNITLDGFNAKVSISGYGITTGNWLGVAPWIDQIANNIVILNVKIGPTASGQGYDCLTIDGTDRFWGYHVECFGAGDGNLDITNTFAGPNSVGYMTLQNSYFHHTQSASGKNVLLGDQSEDYGDYVQTSSSQATGNGGDNKISFIECRFADQLRNPVVFNYHVHILNSLVEGWTYEGFGLFGGMGHLRVEKSIIDATNATPANKNKGIYSQTWGQYADDSRDYKRLVESGNVYRDGATVVIDNPAYLNPAGSIFVPDYSYAGSTVQADNGVSLQNRLSATSELTQGRSGRIDRDGYVTLVDSTP